MNMRRALTLGVAVALLWASWAAWCTPLAAVWVWVAAMALWRWGTRHYQSGGG